MINLSAFYKLIIIIIPIETHLIFGHNIHLQHGDHSKSILHQIDNFRLFCNTGIIQSLHPYTKDCRKFIECFNGQPNVKDCAAGTAFDKNKLMCDHEPKAKCDYWNAANSNTLQTILPQGRNILCPPRTVGTYAYPFDRSYYINCFENKTLIHKCSQGRIYNDIQKKCVSVNIQQIDQSNIIDPYDNFDQCPVHHLPNYFYPYNASKYIQCSRGYMEIIDCAPFKVFSNSRRICWPETQVPYYDRVKVPTPQTTQHDNISCSRKELDLYPHPFSNAKYLKCIYGHMYDKSCRPGYVYNLSGKLCEKYSTTLLRILPPIQNYYSVESKDEMRTSDSLTSLECPATLIGTFIHPMDCTKYINCSPAGTKIETCSTGEFYNFRQEKCVPQSRKYEYDHVECTKDTDSEDSEETFPNSLGVFCSRTGSQKYPHPENEQKFVLCNNSKPEVNWCPKNQVFSIEIRECIEENINEIKKK